MSHENGTEAPGRVSALNFNGTYDLGCFQINTVHLGSKGWTNYNDIFDPSFNAQVAYKIYQNRGWQAWYAVKGIYW